MRLEQHDVELGQKMESQGDVGRERETDAGGNYLSGEKKLKQKMMC